MPTRKKTSPINAPPAGASTPDVIQDPPIVSARIGAPATRNAGRRKSITEGDPYGNAILSILEKDPLPSRQKRAGRQGVKVTQDMEDESRMRARHRRNEKERAERQIDNAFPDYPEPLPNPPPSLPDPPLPNPHGATQSHSNTPTPNQTNLDLLNPNQPHPEHQPETNPLHVVPHRSSSPISTASLAVSASESREALDVWALFEKGDRDLKTRSICLICLNQGVTKDYSVGTSTTTLRAHLEARHLPEYVRKCAEIGFKIQGDLESHHINPLPRPRFTPQSFLSGLVNFVVADDQSINVIECPEFRALLLLLNQQLQDQDIPHRTKVREAILKVWTIEFEKLKQELATSLGKISFTCDMWTDQRLRSYLAVTAHSLQRSSDKKIYLRSDLIAFKHITGYHFGEDLANTMVQILERAGVTSKVGWFTGDGDAKNGAMLQDLGYILREKGIPFDFRERQIICFPHTLHLAVTNVLEESTTPFTGNDIPPEAPANPSLQTWDEALARDPVSIAWHIIHSIRRSTLRRDDFHTIITTGNERHAWGVDENKKPVILKELELLRDSPTRWSSTYLMIERFLYLRPAIERFHILDGTPLTELTTKEWEVLGDIKQILQFPAQVQQVMGAEKTPVLCAAVPALNMLIHHWTELVAAQPRLSNIINAGLRKLDTYSDKMKVSLAFIVTMVLHPTVRFSWILAHWTQPEVRRAEKIFKDEMRKYHILNQGPSAVSSQPLPKSLWGDLAMSLPNLSPRNRQMSVEEEFDLYVHENNRPTLDVDIAQWWDLASQSHPTLFRMALDFIPIQASSVPSERVFSSSAETDTKRRNRINPDLMEALQMLKYLLKKRRLDFMENWNAMDLDTDELVSEERWRTIELAESFEIFSEFSGTEIDD